MLPASDPKQYWDYLDQFLIQIEKELESRSSKTVSLSTLQDLDQYLLELNSFYYRSFHGTFFPGYKRIIDEDIRSLYKISLQEASLKSDIVASVKQHCRLYNQVKNLLQSKRQETISHMSSSLPEGDRRSVDLLYILKDLLHNWNLFVDKISKLQVLLQDQKLLMVLNQYPAHSAVGNLVHSWEPQNSKELRDLNRLMGSWQLAVKLLAKWQENPPTGKGSYQDLLSELKKIDGLWDNRKIPPTLRSWYKLFIQKTFRLYLYALDLWDGKNDRKLILPFIRDFEDWLGSMLYLLEQSLLYKGRGWGDLISNIFLLTRINEDHLIELANFSKRSLKTLDELITGLSSSSQANYQLYSESSSQLLSDAYQFFKRQMDNSASRPVAMLAAEMDSLKNQIGLMENRIELLDEIEQNSGQTSQQYQGLITSIDSYLELLLTIKEELARKLTNRNLKRNFPDIKLRIEQIPLSAGKIFPPDYIHLLDIGAIATQEAEAPERQIIYEEGDIFIIHLDDIKEEEIPKIIIAKKG